MLPKSKILLTGSTGFVGCALLSELQELPDFRVFSAVRSAVSPASDDIVVVGNIDEATDYSSVLDGIKAVVHLAARAHIMCDEAIDPLAVYRKVNVEGTINLARQAAEAGIKRFIYISSVKVNGESTTKNPAYTECMSVKPEDAYGISKYEAEEGLKQVAADTGMEIVIIRPPLVYGKGVKANFLTLLRLSTMQLPLPFACIRNKRSMIYVGNLADFIIRCIDHPAAANQTFLVSDDDDVSLSRLFRLIRRSMGRRPWLVPVPVFLFKLAGKLLGRQAMVDRLVGDLQVDSSKARNLLGWVPPYTIEQGIAATVAGFKNKDK